MQNMPACLLIDKTFIVFKLYQSPVVFLTCFDVQSQRLADVSLRWNSQTLSHWQHTTIQQLWHQWELQ